MTTARYTQELNVVAAALIGVLAFDSSVACATEPLPPSGDAAWSPPRLVLQITVDQLRGDLPERYLKHMGEGGFRYFMDHGVWYADAHHAHANTETIVGHTTLAGGKLVAQRIYRPIETVDVAPTLAASVGAKSPSSSRSGPLLEVVPGSAR